MPIRVADGAQVLAVLDADRAALRVEGLQRPGMAAHGDAHRGPGEGTLQGLFAVAFRQPSDIAAKVPGQGLQALRRQAGVGGKGVAAGRLDDRLGVVAHTQIALDRALDVGLGQAAGHHISAAGCPFRHRMHVGGGAAHVDDDQRPQAGPSRTAVGEKPGPFQHRRRGRHEHRVEHLGGAVDALGVDDAVDEDLADGGTRPVRC